MNRRHAISLMALVTTSWACGATPSEVGVGENVPTAGSDAPADPATTPTGGDAASAGGAGSDDNVDAPAAGGCEALPGLPILCVDATVSGASTYDGSFVAVLPTATCSEYVSGDQFQPDTISLLLVPQDDAPVSFEVFVPAYDGPGTYSNEQVDPGVSVFGPPPPGTNGLGVLYGLPPGGAVTVTVNGDGSGSIEIPELVDDLTGAPPATATATWTCQDPA